jgi:signal peptidase I
MLSVSELLSEFLPSTGRLRMILRGGSMHPYLKDGDILELNAANPDLKKGDIVVFKQNGSLFAHRIVSVSSTKIVTRVMPYPARRN